MDVVTEAVSQADSSSSSSSSVDHGDCRLRAPDEKPRGERKDGRAEITGGSVALAPTAARAGDVGGGSGDLTWGSDDGERRGSGRKIEPELVLDLFESARKSA